MNLPGCLDQDMACSRDQVGQWEGKEYVGKKTIEEQQSAAVLGSDLQDLHRQGLPGPCQWQLRPNGCREHGKFLPIRCSVKVLVQIDGEM